MPTGTPGPWIVHFTYDGLGRLIRKQSPWPTPDQYGRPQVRTEHFYYDGVRRVQENVTDPIAITSEEEPIKIEDEADLPPLATFTLTLREYVHSPGYVDEVVAQVAAKGTLTGSWQNGTPAFTGTPGSWIVHYTYDGLGRLIRKQSPWPTPDQYGRPQVRTEHFYYDGVRRVQETVTDPIAISGDEEPIKIEDEADLPPLATFTLTLRERFQRLAGWM